MSDNPILVEKSDGVLTLTLNRPEKLNALSTDLLLAFRAALKDAAVDDEVRCVLITGAGRGFSSGADLSDTGAGMGAGKPIDLAEALEQRYHPILHLLRQMAKPVVCAINGTAAGAGLNIALACDFVLAAESAKFIQAFIRIGLVPDAGGTWTVPRLIGRARALRWMMSGEAIDANTAEDWGLITAVHPDAELMNAARALAMQLAQAPTAALGRIKQLIDSAEQSDLGSQMSEEARQQRICGQGPDFIEGVSAFIQKRPAKFVGC